MINRAPLDISAASAVQRALSSVIDLYGPSLLRDPDRLKGYLRDNCAGATREITLVMAAMTDGVPQAMLAVHSDDDLRALLPQLVTRLTERAAIERIPATWAVRAWAHALAVSASVLEGGRIAETHPTPPNATHRASASEVLRIVTPADRNVAPAPTRPEESAPRAVALLVSATEAAAADEHRERAADAYAAIEPGVMSDVVPEARIEGADEPRAEADDGVRAEAKPDGPNVTASETKGRSTAADAIAVAHPQATSSGRHGRPFGSLFKVTAAVAAVVVVLVAIRWGMPHSTPIEAASESATVPPQNSSSTAPALQPEGAPGAEVASLNGPAPSAGNSATPMPSIPTEPADSTSALANDAAPATSGATTVPTPTPAAAPQTTPVRKPVVPAPIAPPTIASPSAAKAGKPSSGRPTGAGARSEPRRAEPPLAATPIAAASPQCTRPTCGSVVASRAVDDDSVSASGKASGQASRSYEITIRMDDRSIHTVTQSVRWQPGARVHMTGNRFVQIDAGRTAR